MKALNVNHLYNMILSCIDMRISNIRIVDNETKQNVVINERALKYNPNGFTLVHRGEIQFDPLNNFKQAQQLFSIFLQFQEQDGEFYTQMFYDERDPNDEEKIRIFLRTNVGNYASKYYYNMSLGYIELILAMSGIIVDNLSDFDFRIVTGEKKRKRNLFPQRDLI